MAQRSVATFTKTIGRPPDVVFAYISDVSKHGEWSPKPFHVEGSTGPVKTGDNFVSIGSVPGDKNHRNEVSVTECLPPQRFVLDSVEKGEHFITPLRWPPTAKAAYTRLPVCERGLDRSGVLLRR